MKKLIIFFFFLSYPLHSQYLSLFDIDTTSFPTMKAKFYAYDKDGAQLTNFSISDFTMTENGIPATVKRISCPTVNTTQLLSCVILIDVSGTMKELAGIQRIEFAKFAARTWIEMIPQGSECSIVSFSDNSNIIQDFTINKKLLKDKISYLTPFGNTDYNNAFLDKPNGGLEVAKDGKYKRIIIFITDGLPNYEPNTSAIINYAKSNNIQIFGVNLNIPAPKSIIDFTTKTGGKYFDNISNINEVKIGYNQLLQYTQSISQCEIEWESDFLCNPKNVNVVMNMNNTITTMNYLPSKKFISELIINPNNSNFGKVIPGTKTEQIFSITAKNYDCVITNIKLKEGSNKFSLKNTNFPIIIPKDTSQDITIEYAPIDSSLNFALFELQTNTCNKLLSVRGGFPGNKNVTQTLKLTTPNGNEIFQSGSDTIITWEGVSESDPVSLEFSSDNGKNWKYITNKATGLNYSWKIPNITSNQCLVRVNYYDNNQVPEIEWEKCYGGSGKEFAPEVNLSENGGYFISGTTFSNNGDVTFNRGRGDFWVVKTDNYGKMEWQNSYGNPGIYVDEMFNSAQSTKDNGLIIAGWTNFVDDTLASNGPSRGYIVKIDSVGKAEWQKCFSYLYLDNLISVRQTKDNGFILAGETEWMETGFHGEIDAVLVKLDKSGNLEWGKCIGGSKLDKIFSITTTPDEGYCVVGLTSSKDGDMLIHDMSHEIFVMKLNKIGNIEWENFYGGSRLDICNSIINTYEGGYLISGYTYSNDGDIKGNHGETDYLVMKLDKSGNIEWQKSLGGSASDSSCSALQTPDCGYLIMGTSKSSDGDVTGSSTKEDYWVVKLDEFGSIKWQKSFGGNAGEEGKSIRLTKDGGFIVGGFSYSNDSYVSGNHGFGDYWIVKLSSEVYNQSDVSDKVFSVVKPEVVSKDVEMKQCYIGSVKDSLIKDFVLNIGSYKVRVDSIYFTGEDADAFGLISGMPVYVLETGQGKDTELFFKPKRPGLHNAIVNIIVQSDTLVQNITGEGILPVLSVITDFLNFGEVEIGSKSEIKDTALIKNISIFPLEIADVIHFGPNNKQFSIVSGGGSFSLQPNEVRKLDLIFKPDYSGKTSSQLGFVLKNDNTITITRLFGQGIGQPTIHFDNDSAYAGKNIILKLILKNVNPQELAENSQNYEATIRFQSTILAPVKNPDWYLSNDSTFVTLKGKIDTSNVLAELYVRAGLGTVEETTIDIIEFKLLDNMGNVVDYEFEKYPGKFKLLGICRDGGTRLINPNGKAGIQSIAPNPAGNSIDLEFSTSEIGYTEIAICNTLGEKVLTAFTEDISETGKRNIKINSGEIGNGTYMVIFKSPTVVDTKQIMIVK